MRMLMVSIAMCGALIGFTAAPSATSVTLDGVGSGVGSSVAAAQQPSGQLEVDIEGARGAAWWANPMWMAIGVIGVVVLIAIIAIIARGGGTTVIKE